MNLYVRVAGSHFGSSALFGGAFFAATIVSESFSEALATGSLAAASWFAVAPVLRRLVGGQG